MRNLAVLMQISGYANVGSLDRTLNVYRKFTEDGWNVTFFTSEQTNRDININFDTAIVPQRPYNLPKNSTPYIRQSCRFYILIEEGRSIWSSPTRYMQAFPHRLPENYGALKLSLDAGWYRDENQKQSGQISS